jgi:hypothetical protein
MPDLIRDLCVKWDGPRVKAGVTAEGCGMVVVLQRPAKPMLREITSFMISLVPP